MAHAQMNLSKAHLLLVDDNEQSMEVLTSVLLGLGVKHRLLASRPRPKETETREILDRLAGVRAFIGVPT